MFNTFSKMMKPNTNNQPILRTGESESRESKEDISFCQEEKQEGRDKEDLM